MITEVTEELLPKLGHLISEMHFKALPDAAILALLCEGNKEIEIFLPLDQACSLCEDDGHSYMSNVVSASLDSDVYSDWIALYNYENLRHLVLTCTNRNADYVHDEDLASMQLAVVNLSKLKTLVIRMVGMKESAIDQITGGMIFPGQAFEVSYVTGKGRKKKNRRTDSLPGL